MPIYNWLNEDPTSSLVQRFLLFFFLLFLFQLLLLLPLSFLASSFEIQLFNHFFKSLHTGKSEESSHSQKLDALNPKFSGLPLTCDSPPPPSFPEIVLGSTEEGSLCTHKNTYQIYSKSDLSRLWKWGNNDKKDEVYIWMVYKYTFWKIREVIVNKIKVASKEIQTYIWKEK